MRNSLQVFAVMLIMIGLYFSRAITSIGIGIYIGLSVVRLLLIHFHILKDSSNEDAIVGKFKLATKRSFNKWYIIKPYLMYSLPFIMLLIGVIYSENMVDVWKDIRVRVPLLLMPIAALLFPSINKTEYQRILLFTLFAAVVSTVIPLKNLFTDLDGTIENIRVGGHLEIHINHIRYSMMIAFACLISVWFSMKEQSYRYLYIILSLYLLFFLHLMGVRTGIVILYVGLIILTIYYMIYSRSWIKWFIPFILIAVPIVLYFSIPTLKMKVDYMMWDLKQYQEGNGEDYSDSSRLISFKVAMKSLKGSYLLGHGTGDDFDEMQRIYQQEFPDMNKRINVHNQYVSILLENGIVGLFIFLNLLIFLFNQKKYNVSLIHTIILIGIILSFFVEILLDNSVGLSLFCVWTIIGLQLWRNTVINSDKMLVQQQP